MLTLYVVGYPRSGNVWLGRLLADALGCGYQASDEECIYPGLQRDAPYLVRKSHALETADREHTIFLYRDPRDVAVSIWRYLELPDLAAAIEGMNDHFDKFGVKSYQAMWAGWRKHPARVEVRYEHLHIYPVATLGSVLDVMGIHTSNFECERATNRQAFAATRRRYPDQHHHTRLGTPGNWRGYFTRSEGSLMQGYFGAVMFEQGYIAESDWWEALPERLEP